jgi:hypothetical protein
MVPFNFTGRDSRIDRFGLERVGLGDDVQQLVLQDRDPCRVCLLVSSASHARLLRVMHRM